MILKGFENPSNFGRISFVKKRSYTVVYSKCPDGGYQAYFPSFPEITVWYPSLAECKKAARQALELHIEGIAILGRKIPVEMGRAIKESISVESA